MFNPVYMRQSQLLLRCLPEIAKESCFALKSGNQKAPFAVTGKY